MAGVSRKEAVAGSKRVMPEPVPSMNIPWGSGQMQVTLLSRSSATGVQTDPFRQASPLWVPAHRFPDLSSTSSADRSGPEVFGREPSPTHRFCRCDFPDARGGGGPDRAVRVFGDGEHVTRAGHLVTQEPVVREVVTVDSRAGADPQLVAGVEKKTIYHVVVQRKRVVLVVEEMLEFVAVVAVQPSRRGYPHVSETVLAEVPDAQVARIGRDGAARAAA